MASDEMRERVAETDLRKDLEALLREVLPSVQEEELRARIEERLAFIEERRTKHGGWLT